MHSPREYFHAYLHSLDVEREGLPEAFRGRLCPAPCCTTASPTWSPARRWRRRCYRVFLAQQRIADQLPVVPALLERWLTGRPALRAGPRRRSPRCSTGWSWRPSCATRRWATWPGRPLPATSSEPVVRAAREVILDQAAGLLAQLDDDGRQRRRRGGHASGSRRWSPAPSR